VSLGDLGSLDEDGFLYIADRRVDLIISGGVNVYPAEVEAALTEHEAVVDVAVVGLPDEEWGARVHAVIQSRDPMSPPSAAQLDAHCRERLAPYKVPKSYDFVDARPRTDAGKLRRSALTDTAAS
jgi:bile acid-coenzyme A ligase